MSEANDNSCGDSIRVIHPLFNQVGEGGSIPTSPLPKSAKDLRVERIPFKVALELNKLWHSRLPLMGTGFIKHQPFLCFGAEYKDVIYAIAIWSKPVAPNLPQVEWLELRRLATAPNAPKNTCSRMLRIMEDIIRRSNTQIINLVSYQDTEVHTGGIYKASGWNKTTISQGDTWDRPSRPRPKAQSDAPKQRWEKKLRDGYINPVSRKSKKTFDDPSQGKLFNMNGDTE